VEDMPYEWVNVARQTHRISPENAHRTHYHYTQPVFWSPLLSGLPSPVNQTVRSYLSYYTCSQRDISCLGLDNNNETIWFSGHQNLLLEVPWKRIMLTRLTF
jgi:hypothetical protein